MLQTSVDEPSRPCIGVKQTQQFVGSVQCSCWRFPRLSGYYVYVRWSENACHGQAKGVTPRTSSCSLSGGGNLTAVKQGPAGSFRQRMIYPKK